MISRSYEPLDPHVQPGKVLVIYGARRVGKTTLLQRYLASSRPRARLAIGDDIPTQQVLGSLDLPLIQDYLSGYDLLAVDEAQYIPNIGRSLKLIVDQLPELPVIATGSSSFELTGQIGEPLTGRKRTIVLYAISQGELSSVYNRFDLRQRLDEFLVFGTYPEVITATTRIAKEDLVREIAGSYLLKDILAFERVRSSGRLWGLLKLLAFQIGSEVSLHELGTSLAMDVKTVQRYLDLLEKAFVIYRLGGFSRNLRKEVTQKPKYYFFDNGLRNAVVAQFNPLADRDDVGQLWENFLVTERLKRLAYARDHPNLYFWRTYDQQEVDWVEERGKDLAAYEFKWSRATESSRPGAWARAYPDARCSTVTPDNYLEFLLPA
ncbi:MAG: ATP-binding protein [Chloroflexi bacterium]|nr:ATP-binding protein [Chloroflexota bacterium]MBM3190363.1 ATP-binding protein [Chloroflexota bacterium]